MLAYKGYYAEVEVDLEYGILFGKSVGMRDGFTFHARTVDEVMPALREAVEDYLAFCSDDGVEPELSSLDEITLRLNQQMFLAAVEYSQSQGKSLDAWASAVIEDELRRVGSAP